MPWWNEGSASARGARLLACAVPAVFAACGGSSRVTSESSSGGHGGTAGSAAGSGGQRQPSPTGGSGGAGDHGGGSGTTGRSGSSGTAGHGGSGAGHAGGTGRGGDAAGGSGGTPRGGAGGASAGVAGMDSLAGAAGEGGTAPGNVELGPIEPAVKAYCSAISSCCTAGAEASLATCEADYVSSHAWNLPSIQAGTITADPAVLARCEAAYSGADQCNLNAIVAACQGLLLGTRGVGESCKVGFDCDRSSGTMTCLVTDGSNPDALGACLEVPHGALDEPCVATCATGEECSSTTYGVGATYADCFEEDGLYCASGSTTSVCQAIIPLGGTCGADTQCGSEAHCDITCQALSQLGEDCGFGCRHELQCSAAGKCVDPTWADPEFGCKGWAPAP
jgi:hypothetical protein